MQAVLLKLTAKRTDDGLKTVSREITPVPDDVDDLIKPLWEIFSTEILRLVEIGGD